MVDRFWDQKTFSEKHWEEIKREFGGRLDLDTLGILYRASYSETFGADLRAVIEEVAQPHVIEGWTRAHLIERWT